MKVSFVYWLRLSPVQAQPFFPRRDELSRSFIIGNS